MEILEGINISNHIQTKPFLNAVEIKKNIDIFKCIWIKLHLVYVH